MTEPTGTQLHDGDSPGPGPDPDDWTIPEKAWLSAADADPDNGEHVQVAQLPGGIAVRNSAHPDAVIVFPPREFGMFLDAADEFAHLVP